MFRLILVLLIIGALAWCGATVNLGQRTLFGHLRAVWSTPEANQLKDDLKRKAGPAAEKLRRGVEAGVREVTRERDDAGSRDAGAITRDGGADVLDAGVPGR